jgi:hypothetical protein
VVRIGVAAPLAVLQVVGRMAHAIVVGELQSGLATIGALDPAEVVVERAVLHADDHDVLDAAGRRRGKGGWSPRRHG